MAISSVYRSEPELFALPWIEQAAKALDEKKMIRTFSTTAFETLVAKIAAPENARWITARDTWTALALQRLESGPPQDETQRRVIFEPQISLQLAVARGIAKSTDSRWLATQSPLWTAWANSLSNPQFSPKIHSGIAELLATPIAPEQSRLCKTALRSALERCEDPDLRREYLTAWSKHTDEPELDEKSSIDWILENFDGETPAMRSVMFQAIRSRPDRLARWLDAIDRKQISSTGLDASQIQSLMQVTGELQPRIAKWLSGRVQADRQKVIDRYTDCLSLEVNLERGKKHFIQHCSACHRIDGLGVGIGPDISDSRTQTPTQLLVAILDPNRAIDNNYYRVRVQLNEGTTHDGIVVEESSEHLILKNQHSDRLVLNKTQIEAIKSSGVSLMPEGIEAQLDQQALADLIGYIKNWRYVGGESPVLKKSR
jgi:putative heme-binding domain-containing protein